MTYDETLDKIFDIMLSDVEDSQAEADVQKLIDGAGLDVAKQLFDTLANLFASKQS